MTISSSPSSATPDPSLPIPASVLVQLGIASAPIHPSASPWLPFPWPVQSGSWGILAAQADATDLDWAYALVQLSLDHPPVPMARPQQRSGAADPEGSQASSESPNSSAPSPDLLSFCWALNRVVQAPPIDQRLQAAGYDPLASQLATASHLIQAVQSAKTSPGISEAIQVLVVLELLYREIPIDQHNSIRSGCGEDVMRAAYQMNMVCIDPNDADRTLLQVQRIGLKLLGEVEPQVRAGMEIVLSDGRIV